MYLSCYQLTAGGSVCYTCSKAQVPMAQVNYSLLSRECYHLTSCSQAPAPSRSQSGDFEPCSQSTTTTISRLSKILLRPFSIGFILTNHSPQVYGKPSGHGSYCLVFLTGIVQESQKAFVGTRIVSYPYPGCFNKIGSKLSPAGLGYRTISERLAALDDHWG